MRSAIPSGTPIRITASGVVLGAPGVLASVRCVTAGTITLYDNPSAASGNVIVNAAAMTANQKIDIYELVNNGVYAVISGGEFRITIA